MRRFPGYLPYVYFVLLVPCLIYTVFYTAYSLKLDYADIPTWDAWQCVADLDQLCRFDLTSLWRQHYEHRIIGVQLLYWADFGLLHGHQLLPIACEVICQLSQLALLWWLLRQIDQIPLAFRLAFAAACGLLMTTAIHVQAMVIPFLVVWYLTQALAMFALLLLWRAAQTGRLTYLVIVIAATVLVMYTIGDGMLLWPALLFMAVLLHMPRKHLAALIMAAALSITVYFFGYSFAGQGNAALLLKHPLYAIEFTAIFLGAPASYINNFLGGAVGLFGVMVTMLSVFVMIRGRKRPDAVCVVAAGYCLFTIVSALMAAYGRMNVADPFFVKARAVRYAMIALTFWANAVILIAWLLAHRRRPSGYAWHLATAALSALLLVAVIGQQRNSERRGAVRQARAAEGAIGLETGVQDREALSEVYQDASVLWERTAVLQRRRLAIFATGRQDWIGHPMRDLFAMAPSNACSGSLEALRVVDNGFRVEGRAFDSKANRPPADIVLTNSQGTIVGLGATRAGGYPRPKDRLQRPPSASDWVGFARAARLPGTIQAYAIVGDPKAGCPLGPPQPMPVRFGEELSVLWLPDRPPPRCNNARIELRPGWIEVTPVNEDPQLLFDIGPSPGALRTVIIRARFQKSDRIDAFFGKQVEGRGINGVVPTTNGWVDVYLNLSHNQFWQNEHGVSLRFDPVSSAGAGSTAYIAGVWGSAQSAPSDWPDVQFYPVP